MNQNRKKIAKDHIKQNRVIAIPNITACLAFEKLASYNFCENVTYRAVSLVGHGVTQQGRSLSRKSDVYSVKIHLRLFFQHISFPSSVENQPPEVFCKKSCSQRSPVSEACNFIKKETLAQVFFCEFYETSKNTFFYRTPLGDCFYLYRRRF